MNIGKRLLTFLLLIANLLLALLLVFAYVTSLISPDKLLLPAYATLILPAIIPLNFLFVVVWIFMKKWYAIISIACIVLTWNIIGNTIPVNIKSPETYSGDYDFSLMTYNTYANGMMEKHTEKRPNPVIQHILDEDPDIVCIQEYSANFSNQFLTEEDLMMIFKKYPYKHISYKVKNRNSYFGNATFSKYPIINKQTAEIESVNNTVIYSDIKINDKIVRVFNLHLESNKITESDRVIAMRLKNNFDTENLKGTTIHFSRKLGAAYRIRAKQADVVAKAVEQSPYPVMVVGDFNDLPSSYSYTKIRGKDLKDAYVQRGFGLGWTFVEGWMRFRIDHILFDPSFNLKSFKLNNKVRYSDHFPLSCKIAI